VERYLEQVATIRRPATLKVTRRHIERWKSYLLTRPGLKRAPRLSTGTRRAFLYNLATFFRNIAAWDWPEAPARQLVFPNDYPTKDEPLPRFLPDDAAAAAVQRVATAAGLGRVTPHQLRHTLATQAVNRGMSLESIAAMLGHRSLEMTLVYARIANRTVEKEYFNVTRQLDQHTNIQVTIPEGPGMANLRKEMDWRRLGNGYCTRPKKMPFEYETICETCTMFMTTPEFLPTLQSQKADAERKGQVGRVRIFCDLIAKVEGAYVKRRPIWAAPAE